MSRPFDSHLWREQGRPPFRVPSRTGDSAARPPWFVQSPRLALVGWLILLVLGLYLIRLWQLQFLEGGSWRARAQEQQSRLVTISPPRGVIYDREGKILVRNVPAYNVTITPGKLPDDPEREREVLVRLSQLLATADIDIPYSSAAELGGTYYQPELHLAGRATFPPYGEEPPPGLLEMVDRVRWLEPFTPIVIEQNIDRELALIIAQESGVTIPGVGIEVIPRRNYSYGALTAQILGFLGPIAPEDVAEYEAKGYNAHVDRIGYAGIEAQLEELLRGTPGRRMVAKDVLGQEVEVFSETPPSPGDSVYLTLDVTLQAEVERALQEGLDDAGSRRGVAIVLNPRDGQVLSLVSLPTYNNNMFSGKLDEEAYTNLLKDPHRPFINHAIADTLPPGSIFKVVPAAGGLQEGLINRFTSINCPGRILLPNKFVPEDPALAQPFYCWINLPPHGGSHGPLNVVDALAQSCDVFFYELGGGFEETDMEGLGVIRLAQYAREFGLGSPTGIDIPGEMEGLVPTPDWKRRRYHETWTTGNTYNLAIGQGDLLVTPLQMANAYAAVANGGTLYTPQLVHHVVDAQGNVIRPFQPVISHTLPIDAPVWQVVHEGLDLTVSESGTGHRATLDELGISVAGKTGTAEYCDDIAYEAGMCDVAPGETLPTHAWFVSYAPTEAPEIVVVVWIYDGGEGSVEAAPVAREIMEYYFRRTRGILEEAAQEADETEADTPPPETLPAP